MSPKKTFLVTNSIFRCLYTATFPLTIISDETVIVCKGFVDRTLAQENTTGYSSTELVPGNLTHMILNYISSETTGSLFYLYSKINNLRFASSSRALSFVRRIQPLRPKITCTCRVLCLECSVVSSSPT